MNDAHLMLMASMSPREFHDFREAFKVLIRSGMSQLDAISALLEGLNRKRRQFDSQVEARFKRA